MEIGNAIIRGWELLDRTGDRSLRLEDLEVVMISVYYVTDSQVTPEAFAEAAMKAAMRYKEKKW